MSLARGLACLVVAVLLSGPAASIAEAQHDHAAPATVGRWTWTTQGQAFLNLNLQTRKFRDFNQIESQNWMMVGATRQSGRARWMVHLMASAEPWTLRRLGSAQVFQTGETLDRAPLRDYQHPHDLLMALDARFDWTVSSRTTWFVSAGPVASPALGPDAFMHRESAGPNPTAPLAHHMLDSTHITHGVVTAGVKRDAWTVDASVFRGREPDEDRVRLDMGPLDSVSARVTWQRGAWRAQMSAAHMNNPEVAEPGDVVRTTASVEYRGGADNRTAWMAAWGRNDRATHAETGWLIEGRRRFGVRDVVYTRAEMVDRFILVDFDYAAQFGVERHLRSPIAAWTVGYERQFHTTMRTTAALGADVTLHRTAANLRDSYGHPISWHLFLRLAAR
jgi:hypothetical protein